MKPALFLAVGLLLMAGTAASQPAKTLLPPPVAPAAGQLPLLRTRAPLLALTHIRIVDGTGQPPLEDRTLVIDHGRIASILPGGAAVPPGAEALDLSGETVLPGIVGMHDHLYYIARPNLDAGGRAEQPLLVPQMTFSAPRLYLAGGVTTLRTTGSVEPYADLNLKHEIDAGRLPGPHLDVTGPYLEGQGGGFIQMYALRDAEDARQTVAYWADRGVTSFKAYMNITRAELAATIDEVHRRGLKITGHLCSVTYAEAADLGIDDLEHGFVVNTQFEAGKQPDICPASGSVQTLLHMDPAGPEATALIAKLVAHHVAVTSTLPVFEGFFSRGTVKPSAAMLDAMTPQARAALTATLAAKSRLAPEIGARLFARDMALERAFAAAGGLLMAGPDPTGGGNVLPGFGDQREIELLVQAGFSPLEAIRIATWNGAVYLGVQDRIGSIEPGKHADLMVVHGNPAVTIADIEHVDLVFKDGVAYDAARLLASVRGDYGQY